MMGLTIVATVITLIPLFLILGYLLTKGASSINLDFFIKLPKPVGEPGGGMANAIVGTLELIGLSALFGVPIGIGVGLFQVEFGRYNSVWGPLVRFSTESLTGIPSVVVGLFAYSIIVRPMGTFSAFAGGLALGIMMIPLVARATEEMLLLVPGELREASLALGIPRWRTALSVVVRTAAAGIVTAVILATARIAGETAPLLFTAFGNRFWSNGITQPVSSLTLQIYTYAISPFPDWQRQAWAGALVLTALVFVLQFGVRRIVGAGQTVQR